ncbi:hypothetical protein [Acinetobacter larvae]|uniref:Uncharacterized protein n=1 Tax=Acinetobacter larvae TaxID=1789224 RepID=A0A1B2M2V0_9GAMM|nr:hypothetical protein [Acinetobacter larvae]AOA59471.1 hypothetical protein BFG52_14700 [Acinetobacter larvae]
MFKNYLKDYDEYIKLEKYVYDYFLESIDDKKWITPYYQTHFMDGTPFFDANPIYSAKNLEENYIIKLIIDENSQKIIKFKSNIDSTKLYTYICNIKKLKKTIKKIQKKHFNRT